MSDPKMIEAIVSVHLARIGIGGEPTDGDRRRFAGYVRDIEAAGYEIVPKREPYVPPKGGLRALTDGLHDLYRHTGCDWNLHINVCLTEPVCPVVGIVPDDEKMDDLTRYTCWADTIEEGVAKAVAAAKRELIDGIPINPEAPFTNPADHKFDDWLKQAPPARPTPASTGRTAAVTTLEEALPCECGYHVKAEIGRHMMNCPTRHRPAVSALLASRDTEIAALKARVVELNRLVLSTVKESVAYIEAEHDAIRAKTIEECWAIAKRIDDGIAADIRALLPNPSETGSE